LLTNESLSGKEELNYVKKLFSGVVLSIGLLLGSASAYATDLVDLTLGLNIMNASVSIMNYGYTSSLDSAEILPYSYPTALEKRSLPTFLASEGFSSVQGKNNWYYQEWNGSSYVDMTWNSSFGRWAGYTTDSIIADNWQHPERATDSVRKWVAPQSGSINITSNVAKRFNGLGGDGVVVTVKKNDTTVWSTSIAATDSVGKNMDLTLSVTAGDAIYFVLNRGSGYTYDSTNWNPKIEYK
jgi:hypothetical protein